MYIVSNIGNVLVQVFKIQFDFGTHIYNLLLFVNVVQMQFVVKFVFWYNNLNLHQTSLNFYH